MNKIVVFLIGLAAGIILITALEKIVEDQNNCESDIQELIVQESLK